MYSATPSARLLLVHGRQADDVELVEGALRRVHEALPALADRGDGVVVREPDVGTPVVEVLLHLPDERPPGVLIRGQLLLRVHRVVVLVAHTGVTPTTELTTRHDREHEVGIDQR